MKKIVLAVAVVTLLYFFGNQILTRLMSAYLTVTHQVPAI